MAALRVVKFPPSRVPRVLESPFVQPSATKKGERRKKSERKDARRLRAMVKVHYHRRPTSTSSSSQQPFAASLAPRCACVGGRTKALALVLVNA